MVLPASAELASSLDAAMVNDQGDLSALGIMTVF